MSTYSPGTVRSVEDVQRELNRIRQALERAYPHINWETIHTEPTKMLGGMVVLADGVDWDPGDGPGLYRRNEANSAWVKVGGTAVLWGSITGTLSSQADLQAALDAKLDDSQIDTDGTLAANSDALIASQKATKTYVDAAVGGVNADIIETQVFS